MGDTKIVYTEEFGINTFKREICAAFGEEFWDTLVKDIELPNIATEASCQCRNMHIFMKRFEEMADAETVKNILYNVRHGLHPSQSEWAHDEFLEMGDLDKFLQKHLEDELNHFVDLNREKKDFYGQDITDEVLEFIKQNLSMLAPVRKGNKLCCMAFPANMSEYLKATDSKVKRYHACHCPFAKESILSDSIVSAALCNCSLGHVMNFTEAFLGRALEGKVVHSVLNGDLTCEYEITIPDDIMYTYVNKEEADTIISNYHRYYMAFTRSGIIDFHEGSVNWIIPKEGEKGPEIAFQVHLDADTVEEEMQNLIVGIRAKKVPQIWHITPDSTPVNIMEIMKRNGFKDLGENAPEPEPTMLLNRSDFQPYLSSDNSVVCRKVQTKEDFQKWIDVVNTALHGWDMIDAENYYTWVESEDISIYLGEINGIPVSTAATIQNGEVASLEFVSTLEAYRRRKFAAIVCSRAIQDQFDMDIKAVTLGACGESAHLYKKLGFKSIFNNIVMQYDI